ncbi:hypothetical protein K4F52_004766 [Lecanicillium sp. MT-2017a]|nr:hypothetical protein K4F52_004766 [Lecanicillium sp. MT-2017a]
MDRVVGYYEGFAARRECMQVLPLDIARGVYTHLNFAFATIDPNKFEVLLTHKNDYILYRDMVSLKQFDGNVKVFLSIGGWNHDEHDGSTSVMTTFSRLAASEKHQKAFFKSLVNVLGAFGFDGVDIHWPYPGQSELGGQDQDFDNYPKFIEKLKSNLDKKSRARNGLTVAVPLRRDTLKHFDMAKLQPSVDFFNISLVLKPHANITDTKVALDLLWGKDIDPSKVVLGTTFQVKSAIPADKKCVDPGCPSIGPAPIDRCSFTVGAMPPVEARPYREYNHDYRFHLDKETGVKYYIDGIRWLSFEDPSTLRLKTDLAQSQCLGGIMVWSVGDDEDGKRSTQLRNLTGYHSHHPLMHENDDVLQQARYDSPAKRVREEHQALLDRADPAAVVGGCTLYGSYDRSSLIGKILCTPYPSRRYRKVSSVPDHPQIPGGYRSPYMSERVRHPEGARPAKGTTERCGKWHVASAGDMGKTLLQISDSDISLLEKANPSVSRHSLSKSLKVGEAYCVAPVESFTVRYNDMGCFYNINREVLVVREYLQYDVHDDPMMTVDKCAKRCMIDSHQPYFGVKNGRRCICSYGLNHDTTKVKDKYCNKPCGGNPDVNCGGRKYTRVFSKWHTLTVLNSPEYDRPEDSGGFLRGGGGGCGSGGGMKNAWGGPDS